MANVVMALLTRTETAPAILAGAEHLAMLLGDARIEAMVARTVPVSTIMPTEEVLTENREAAIRTHEAQRATALKGVFDSWATSCGQAGPSPHWIDEEGTYESLMRSWGGRADYIVVGRPEPHANHAEHSALHAALFATDRPVLIMPPNARPDFGKIVAVAWREDKFTLHAVLAALHFMSNAQAVHVLTGHRDGDAVTTCPDVLMEHGIAAIPHKLVIGQEVFGAQLLAKAHGLKADLLVMGAFVHGAWHNMLFGGVTEYILAHADIPVLMRH